MQGLPGDLDLDRRLGEQLAPAPLFYETGVIDDAERRRIVSGMAPDQELERRLGALEGENFRLELLDELRQLARVHETLQLMAELAGPDGRVRPAAELRYD